MGRSRKARRRSERARAKRPASTRALSPFARAGLIAGGVACILGGVALLVAGGPGTAARLGRVAGILIVSARLSASPALIGHL